MSKNNNALLEEIALNTSSSGSGGATSQLQTVANQYLDNITTSTSETSNQINQVNVLLQKNKIQDITSFIQNNGNELILELNSINPDFLQEHTVLSMSVNCNTIKYNDLAKFRVITNNEVNLNYCVEISEKNFDNTNIDNFIISIPIIQRDNCIIKFYCKNNTLNSLNVNFAFILNKPNMEFKGRLERIKNDVSYTTKSQPMEYDSNDNLIKVYHQCLYDSLIEEITYYNNPNSGNIVELGRNYKN